MGRAGGGRKGQEETRDERSKTPPRRRRCVLYVRLRILSSPCTHLYVGSCAELVRTLSHARVSAASDVPLRDNLQVSVRRSVGGFRCCATPPPLVQARAYSPTAYYTSRFLRSLLARPLNAAAPRRRWRRNVYKTSRVATEMPLVVSYSLTLAPSHSLFPAFPLALRNRENFNVHSRGIRRTVSRRTIYDLCASCVYYISVAWKNGHRGILRFRFFPFNFAPLLFPCALYRELN